MEPQRRHNHGPPVPVVAWIVDVLQAKRGVDPPPHMECVISLNNVFAPVPQAAVTEQKALASKREVYLVVPLDAV